MKKIMKYMVCLVLILGTTQCKDYLDVKAPNRSDDLFVTASLSEANKMLSWLYGQYRLLVKGRNYNFQDPLGSFAEFMHESTATTNNTIARLEPEAMATTMESGSVGFCFDEASRAMGRAELIMDAIAATDGYQSGDPGWLQAYGEAAVMWALCAFKHAIHFGDVPFGYTNKYVEEYTLMSRFDIFDLAIEQLKEVEGTMYRVGEGGITAERLNRSFANALIGQIALYAGSWQTIRLDADAKRGQPTVTSPGALYAGRTFEPYKWEDLNSSGRDGAGAECAYTRLVKAERDVYLNMAADYLDRAINGDAKGSVIKLFETDPRTDVNNAPQLHWQIINDRGRNPHAFGGASPESFFEVGCIQDQNAADQEHPYSMGRAAANAALGGHNLNSFGAIRIIPNYYYKSYETGDLRRDFSMVVTGHNGAAAAGTIGAANTSIPAPAGAETLIPFNANTRVAGGGVSISKWDFNISTAPSALPAPRRSGMNYTVLRMPDAMLMLAEAYAQTGNEAGAIALVNKIRARAGVGNIGALTGDALLDAIYNERALELIGEGAIRWDMIRSGNFNELATAARNEFNAMLDGLEANGYYTFNQGQLNERTISDYVWVKLVSIDGETKVVRNADPNDPAKYPGWRGVYDWNPTGQAKNLAIRGLFDRIVPGSPEAVALEADGYTRLDWGRTLPANRNAFLRNFLPGMVGRATMPPRYYHPIPADIITAPEARFVSNGYGLPQR